MLVHPLALGVVARVPEHFQNLPAVDVSVAVLRQRAIEPTDAGRTRDGVEAESPDRAGVVAVDGETHRVSVCCGQYRGRVG